jgi:uncharacterized Zn finger protein
MNLFKKSIMELNLLYVSRNDGGGTTYSSYIDLPKDVIYRKGDVIIIDDEEYVIHKVKYHIRDGKIFQITYITYEEKREPLTEEQIKLFRAMNIPLYA